MAFNAAPSFGRLLAGRAVQAVVVAIIVSILGFAMLEALPGDAAFRIAAGRYGYDALNAAAAEQVRTELGLDQPTIVRLLHWISQLVVLDLGQSAVNGERVSAAIAHQLGHSGLLAGVALALALVIAVPIGVAAGLKPGGALDRLSAAAAVIIRATPAFLIGLFLMLVLAVELRLVPAAGHGRGTNIILPALTLALVLAAVLSRVIAQSLSDVLAGEAFQFARYKGLSRRQALLRHGLRNAAVPVVAYLGVQAALLIEGVVVVESVFGWPGIGHAMTHAIFERDVPMLQGTALVLGLSFVLLSLAVDLACRALDPRGAR